MVCIKIPGLLYPWFLTTTYVSVLTSDQEIFSINIIRPISNMPLQNNILFKPVHDDNNAVQVNIKR